MTSDDLLRRPEGKTLEFKRDLSSPRSALRTLVAFANSAGGRLVVGVEDRTRNVLGVERPLDMEERVANLVADSIEPRLLPEIEILPWGNTYLLVIEVHPSPLRPHHLRADGQERGTYVRLGSTNRRADTSLIAELERRVTSGSYDEQPIPDLNYEALDFAAASECFSELRTLRQRDMEALGLAASYDGRKVPTVGGLILFGRDRLARFPDAWIQAGRFAGTDRVDLVDRTEFREYPTTALEYAIRFVERNTRTGAEIGRLKRRDLPTVPPVALREALVNAVVHADYAQRGAPIRLAVFDDRVEIENPGILLPGLTLDEIADGVSRLRNRVIGRVLKELGLVEQWGSGIRRMIAACTDAGLPAPDFAEIGLRFRVTLWTVPRVPVVTDPMERLILDHVAVPGGRSTSEIAAHIGVTPRTAQSRLARLAGRGLVIAVGSGPRDPRRRWFTTGPTEPEASLPS